jgi:hypothetical protein
MILDSQLLLGKNISHASKSANSVVSFTNVLQMDGVKKMLMNNASGRYDFAARSANAVNDLGAAGDLMLNIRVTSSKSGLTASSAAAHLQVRLHKKASASSIKSGSVVFTYEVKSIKKAASQASWQKLGSYIVRAKIPRDIWGDTTKKYIGLTTKVITGKIAKGKLTAWLGLADDTAL